jgi:hypothetical protein
MFATMRRLRCSTHLEPRFPIFKCKNPVKISKF